VSTTTRSVISSSSWLGRRPLARSASVTVRAKPWCASWSAETFTEIAKSAGIAVAQSAASQQAWCALASPGEALSAQHLAAVAGPQPSASQSQDRRQASARPALVVRLQDEVEALERRLLRDALARCGGNRSHAAAQLGLSRQGLRNRMQRYEID
jgi:transcriptional regulator with GAF, ATPase, and Fis domain